MYAGQTTKIKFKKVSVKKPDWRSGENLGSLVMG